MYNDIPAFLASKKEEQEKQIKFLEILDHDLPDSLNEIVDLADEYVWKQIDCKACAHCCKTMTPYYNDTDIQRIAQHLNLSESEFKDTYLDFEVATNKWVHDALPCTFLKDNLCSIYEVRPDDCKEFPHHYKRPFDKYTDTFKFTVKKCPATFFLLNNVMACVQDNYDGFETD